MLAARYHLPFVELTMTGVDKKASTLLPLHVLERASALPYALSDGVLHIAIADPALCDAVTTSATPPPVTSVPSTANAVM